MENTATKISFGFKKTTDKPNFLKNKVESVQDVKKVELIESIEGSQLKIHGKDPKDDELKKLVIPMTNDQKTRPISRLIESRKIKKEKEENGSAENTQMEVDNETLEQKAAREILEDLKNATIKTENNDFEVPLHPDELPLNGATESTLDDYERVQIADFGKAMLRGMGWKDEQEKDDPKKFEVPTVRPKGLGLGADKAVKKQKLLVQPAPNEVLEIKKKAFIKILAGKHKNMYGTIEGFDDGGGRLIIKLAIGGMKVLMNEFMVQPISKQEYTKYSKVLNSEKYEEYKNDENKTSSFVDKPVKTERRSRSTSPSASSRGRDDNNASRGKDEQMFSRGRDENRRNKSQERERSRERNNRRRSRERASNYYKKDKRHYSSDSEDDKTYNRKYNERQRSRSHDKHRRRHSSSDSSSERHRSRKKVSKKSSKNKSKKHSSPERYHSSDEERHHKRKYKRSKHHRDRS